MKKTFSISIGIIRKIMLKLLLKRKSIIALLIFIFGTLLFSIYLIIIGNFVDPEAFQMAYSSLGLFVIMIISFFVSTCIYLFKFIKGKNKTSITYEYEFNHDTVSVKNLYKDKIYLLNKKYIKNHYVVNNVLVVVETLTYFFSNDDEVKKELLISFK